MMTRDIHCSVAAGLFRDAFQRWELYWSGTGGRGVRSRGGATTTAVCAGGHRRALLCTISAGTYRSPRLLCLNACPRPSCWYVPASIRVSYRLSACMLCCAHDVVFQAAFGGRTFLHVVAGGAGLSIGAINGVPNSPQYHGCRVMLSSVLLTNE